MGESGGLRTVVIVKKSCLRLFNEQKELLVDLTDYLDSCVLTTSVDYLYRFGGIQEPISKNYEMSIAGYNLEGIEKKLFMIQRNDRSLRFEYRQSEQNYLFGLAFIKSLSFDSWKWDLELLCSDVCPGRIQEEEQTTVVVKSGRQIAREGYE